MDEIKKITQEQLKEIIAEKGFDPDLMLKDYYVTVLLYLVKDIEGIYFKGGTALQKIFLNHSRISEDIDFSLTKSVQEVKERITEKIKDSNLFQKITKDKDVEGFIRLVLHYKDFSDKDDVIFIDLNKRAELLLKPEKHTIHHFYKGFIPEFKVNTLAKEEMIAEKVTAAIGRNMPRDHYDIYHIIKAKLPINLEMVKRKSEEFSIIKMFNKAKKLKNRWDSDLLPLITEEVSFQEVMKTLSGYFNLKEEKEKLKDKK